MNPNLYVVTAPGGARSWLFGSRHCVTAPWAPSAGLLAVIRGARTILLEHDGVARTSQNPFLPPLRDDPRFPRLRACLADAGLLSLTVIEVVQLTTTVLSSQLGFQINVDSMLAALRRGATLGWLEDSVEVCARLRATLVDDELVAWLESCKGGADAGWLADARALELAWRAGCVGRMREMYCAPGRQSLFCPRALQADRNRAWLPRLTAELQQGNALAIVGAAHLFAQDNLIDMLEGENYTVEAA